MKKKVYLSGPMRGHPEFNFPAFETASKIIRKECPEIDLISPHEMDLEIENVKRFDPVKFDPETDDDVKKHLRTVLKRDAMVVLDSDAVLTLEGWEDSKGACAEVMLAHAAGIPNMPWERMIYKIPNRVALCGPKGVGKSTFAKRACVDYYKWSFAQPIRDMLSQLPIDSIYLNENKEVEIPAFKVTGRQLLQTLGTEWGRSQDELMWVTCMAIKIDQLNLDRNNGLPVGNEIVIDDLRFRNEAVMLKDYGFKIWSVNREGFRPVNDSHPSEQGISDDLIDKAIWV